MRKPYAADEGEANYIAQEVGPSLRQCRQHLLGWSRDRKFEHEQRDDDGEDTIGESFESIERQGAGLYPGAVTDIELFLFGFHIMFQCEVNWMCSKRIDHVGAGASPAPT